MSDSEIKIDLGQETLKEVFLNATAKAVDKFLQGDTVMTVIRQTVTGVLNRDAAREKLIGAVDRVIESDLIGKILSNEVASSTVKDAVKYKITSYVGDYLRNNIGKIVEPIIKEALHDDENFKTALRHQALMNTNDRVKKLLRQSVNEAKTQ